jgi:hypothetical protein
MLVGNIIPYSGLQLLLEEVEFNHDKTVDGIKQIIN